MKQHIVCVHPEKTLLARQDQLAWKLAECALDPAPISPEVTDMVINRLIDNMSVALASLNRIPVQIAQDQAMSYPKNPGAVIMGYSNQHKFSADWCAYANGVAVRELDFHDTFLAKDYAHPADSIPPVLAVAQQTSCNGQDLLRGIVSAYEVHIALVKSINLHKHKIDHIAHLCPAQVAGIGALLSMDCKKLYQAINQAVHVSFTTRQSRKGAISSWKAFAPAHSGKLAITAIDRCIRGGDAPTPIYEGEDSVIARLLDGPQAQYFVTLPEKGEEKSLILESYTKEYPAEYQAQALIDLAFEIRKQVSNLEEVKEIIIYTSHHTHYVIGTGSKDPQKQDPKANRETLDHSITYIFAVALEDGFLKPVESYNPQRAGRLSTIRLWHKIKTCEEEKWTKLYHHPDPNKKSFGGRVKIVFKDGSILVSEKHCACAHPNGERPFTRSDYIQKFMELSQLVSVEKSVEKSVEEEKTRFLSLVQRLPELSAQEVQSLNVQTQAHWAKKSTGIL